jgi:hypothetical protein
MSVAISLGNLFIDKILIPSPSNGWYRVDQLSGIIRPRMRIDSFRFPDLLDPAPVHHQDAITDEAYY